MNVSSLQLSSIVLANLIEHVARPPKVHRVPYIRRFGTTDIQDVCMRLVQVDESMHK